MADTKTASRSRPTKTRRRSTTTRAASTAATLATNGKKGGTVAHRPSATTRPAGGVTLDDTVAPAGTSATTLEADVTDELGRVAPTFGNVLSSIGLGVASSQTALDSGLIDSVKALADKKIKVVTDVIQVLDDDGLPDLEATDLITQEVSVLNFITPTVHEWKYVRLSMDLSVGEIDNTSGFTFDRMQTRSGMDAVGLFWGFVGWFDSYDTYDFTTSTTSTRQEVDWSQGQVRVDALLAPREVDGFAPPAQVDIGPQIYFAQGSVADTTTAGVRTRAIQVRIKVLKASGAANGGKSLVVEAPGLQIGFTTNSTTDATGEVEVTLGRVVPVGAPVAPVQFPVTVSLGKIRRSAQVTL